MLKIYPRMGMAIAFILLGTHAFSQCIPPLNQTVTPANTNIVCGGNATINVATTETGVNYYLRNDADNSIVAGPVAGIGGPINLISNRVNSATTFNINAVKVSTALDFERAVTSHVNLGTSINSVFEGNNQITVEAWIYTESRTNLQSITGNYNGPMQFLLRLDDGKPVFWVSDGGFAAAGGANEIPLNTWVHLAGTWDGTTVNIYQDGLLVGSTLKSGTFPAVSNDLLIGASLVNESFDGKIDNLKIWKVAKTASEIDADKSICLTGPTANLVAMYNFDVVSTTTLTDESGNNYDGTLVSSPKWTSGTTICSNAPCSLQMTTKPTITINSIAQQTVTNTNVICSGKGVANVASTQNGVNYYLRNDADNSVVDGPVAGTGNSIQFHTGWLTNNATYNVLGSKPTYALNFDGVDDHGVIPASTNINSLFSNNAITLEGWYYIDSKNYAEVMLMGESYLGDNNITFSMYISGSTLKAGFFNGAWQTTEATVPFNQWVHIASTYDQSDIKLYFNGILASSQPNTVALPVGSEGWRIGRRWDGDYNSDFFFKGKMDQVRIWNVAHTATEIQNSMNACLSGSESNLVSEFKFEEDGSVAIDAAGNDQNALLLNFDLSTQFTNGIESCPTTCMLEMTAKPTVMVNPIAQQTITPASSSLICGGNVTVNVASTEAGINYYLRNDADNAIVAGPVSGTGSAITFNTGTITSTATFNVNAKKVPGGLNFDGNDDYVTSPEITMGATFTFETWVKTNDASPEWSGIITTNSRAGSGMVVQFSLADNGTLRWESPSLYIPNMSTVINDNAWHHVAVVSDGSSLTFYVDGNIENTSSFAAAPFTRNIQFMAEREANGFVPGLMDEARVWSVARTQPEIQASMNGCALTGMETGLEIYYKFEDGTGSSTVTDLAGGDQDGTLVNMNPTTAWSAGIDNCPCETEMLTKPSVTVNSIADQVATAAQTTLCNSGSTTINLASSETTVDYYLRNDLDDAIVAGPLAGTGTGISFNTGTISATTTYNVLADRPKPTPALHFDGGDDYISIPSGISIDNQSFSIEFWAKRTGSGASYIMGQGSNQSSNESLHIGFRDDNTFTFAFYGNDLDITSGVPTDGAYHHWSCVYNAGQSGTDRFVYLDGNLVGSDNASGDFIGSGEFRIGDHMFSNNYFNGDIDEVRIWNRALTQAETQDQPNSLTGSENGLIAYYTMNNIFTVTLTDVSGNGHDGTLINMDPATPLSYCQSEMTQTATVTVHSSTTSTITKAACDTYTAPDNVVYTTSGTKTAVIPNVAGCDSTITINLTINTVDASITQIGNVLTATATGAGYSWKNCTTNNVISGETGQNYTATANGDYAVTVTENNCTATSTCITVTITGISSNSNFDSQFSVYPNPNNGSFVINSNGEGTYSIVNNLGQTVQTIQLTGTQTSFEINNLDNGVYFIVGFKDNQITRQKIVVTK